MLLRLLEEKRPVDDIVMFDTGWEFPQLVEHVYQVQEYIGREITVLKPAMSFEYTMLAKPLKSGRVGYSWPSATRRWCTAEKRDSIRRYSKKIGAYSEYIGYAADEVKRTGCGNSCAGEEKNGVNRLYPLIYDWDMDEKDCLQYCYDRGFTWGGLYQQFKRVSCFCCPLSRLGELKTLRREHPGLWSKMLEWDSVMPENRGFHGYKTVHDLDRRFAEEDRQITFWEDLAA